MGYKIQDGKVKIVFFDGDNIEFHWGHLGEVVEVIKSLIKEHEEEYGLKFVEPK